MNEWFTKYEEVTIAVVVFVCISLHPLQTPVIPRVKKRRVTNEEILILIPVSKSFFIGLIGVINIESTKSERIET